MGRQTAVAGTSNTSRLQQRQEWVDCRPTVCHSFLRFLPKLEGLRLALWSAFFISTFASAAISAHSPAGDLDMLAGYCKGVFEARAEFFQTTAGGGMPGAEEVRRQFEPKNTRALAQVEQFLASRSVRTENEPFQAALRQGHDDFNRAALPSILCQGDANKLKEWCSSTVDPAAPARMKRCSDPDWLGTRNPRTEDE